MKEAGGGTNFYDPTLSCTPVFPPLLENSGIVQEVFALGPVRTHLMNVSDFYGFNGRAEVPILTSRSSL